MRFPSFLLLPLSFSLTSCGPSEEELRAELRTVDQKLMAISLAANRHRARMSQAEVDAHFGSFAAGYGTTSGTYGLASDEYNTTSQASFQYDVSSLSLDQLMGEQHAYSSRDGGKSWKRCSNNKES